MDVKVYVAVVVRYTPEGEIQPISIEWEDGRVFNVDRVSGVRRAASLKAGGVGIRYSVEIGGKTTYLFLEESRWFVERKINNIMG